MNVPDSVVVVVPVVVVPVVVVPAVVVPVVVVPVVVVPVVVVVVVVVGDVVVVCPEAPGPTVAVGLDVATEDPFLFVAVTVIRNVEPTSPEVGAYDAEPLPTAEHELPDASQRCHWKL